MTTSYITPNEKGIIEFKPTSTVWVLVHNGKKIISLKEMSVGTLSTMQKVFVADTQAEAQAEADLLKLEALPVDKKGVLPQPKS